MSTLSSVAPSVSSAPSLSAPTATASAAQAMEKLNLASKPPVVFRGKTGKGLNVMSNYLSQIIRLKQFLNSNDMFATSTL